MSKLKKTKVDLLLDCLSDSQWHSNDELATCVSFRFGDAIYKARRLGHNIETKQRGVQHWYRWHRK